MFNSKIVFVLGAGAGQEIDMPVGRGLADAIARKMALTFDHRGVLVGHGDHTLFNEVANVIGREEALRAAKRLFLGLPLVKSIDEFLDYNNADSNLVLMGKAAIARSILEAENGSKLIDTTMAARPTFTVSGAYGSWLIYLMRMLGQGDPARLLENVTFINFNYDRCLEYFLLNAFQSLYEITAEEAKQFISIANIFHPYGSVGKLKVFDKARGIPYGWTFGDSQPIANQIRTYTEEIDEPSRLKSVHESLQSAKALVFLGFAFHKQNMELLSPAEGLGTTKIFATANGISESDSHVVLERLGRLFPEVWSGMLRNGLVHLRRDKKCVELMEEYQLTLPNL